MLQLQSVILVIFVGFISILSTYIIQVSVLCRTTDLDAEWYVYIYVHLLTVTAHSNNKYLCVTDSEDSKLCHTR